MLSRTATAISVGVRRLPGATIAPVSHVRTFYVKKSEVPSDEGNIKPMKDDATQLKEARKQNVGGKAEKDRGSQPSQNEGLRADARDVPSGAKTPEMKEQERLSSQREPQKRTGVDAGYKAGP
jgi:hypothetical protein